MSKKDDTSLPVSMEPIAEGFGRSVEPQRADYAEEGTAEAEMKRKVNVVARINAGYGGRGAQARRNPADDVEEDLDQVSFPETVPDADTSRLNNLLKRYSPTEQVSAQLRLPTTRPQDGNVLDGGEVTRSFIQEHTPGGV